MTNFLNHLPNLFKCSPGKMVILIFFLIANITTWIFIHEKFSVNDINFVNKYSLLDPSRSYISQDNYIVNLQPLREDLNNLSNDFGIDSVSIYVEFLNTGGNISINPNNYIWPASLSKLPLSMAVVKKIEKGVWAWDNELVLLKEDVNEKSGDEQDPLSDSVIGTRFTIEFLLEVLLTESDNTAYYILLRNLSAADLKLVIQEIGIEAMFSEEGKVSSKEYSRIFRSLYTSSFLEPENSQKILEWLSESEFDSFLSKGLPGDVRFSHKYGENIDLNAYSDSGIVYVKNRPYIISVMVQGKEDGEYYIEKEKAASFMKTVSDMVYDYFSSYQKK